MSTKSKTAVVTSLVGRGIEVLAEHFVGLWKFNVLGKRPGWCVTLNVRGYYFDTEPADTAVAALHAARHTLKHALEATSKARG